jgi:hypothetical protein
LKSFEQNAVKVCQSKQFWPLAVQSAHPRQRRVSPRRGSAGPARRGRPLSAGPCGVEPPCRTTFPALPLCATRPAPTCRNTVVPAPRRLANHAPSYACTTFVPMPRPTFAYVRAKSSLGAIRNPMFPSCARSPLSVLFCRSCHWRPRRAPPSGRRCRQPVPLLPPLGPPVSPPFTIAQAEPQAHRSKASSSARRPAPPAVPASHLSTTSKHINRALVNPRSSSTLSRPKPPARSPDSGRSCRPLGPRVTL